MSEFSPVGSNRPLPLIPPSEPRPRKLLEDDMAYASPAYRRVLCRDLEVLEAELQMTATAGRPSPWIERLRERVRKVRERMERDRGDR
ncbi:hypothetical protein KF840_25935 [bacterium]|nr:hypothetical protein [bacterium]